MNEEVRLETVHIHSRADELIACLEGEIAKRDEVIVGLANSRDFWREKAITADDELAAIKAQGVVMPEPMKRGDEGGSGEYGAAMIRGYNACLREVARLNAAPVQRVSVPDGWEASLNLALVLETERAIKQRDEFLKTGISTAALGGSHDTCFAAIVRRHIAMLTAAPAAPAADAGLVEALKTIAQWRLPETGQFWPSGGPVSYEAQHGSNGARDYMREVAQAAIAAHRAKGVV